MLKTGILNPQINSLLSRVRHTNLLVIADRGFPFLPGIECIDITLTDDIPTVIEVFEAVTSNFVIGNVWMAEEFIETNQPSERAQAMLQVIKEHALNFESHVALKQRAAGAIGLIRTADSLQYSNLVIESA